MVDHTRRRSWKESVQVHSSAPNIFWFKPFFCRKVKTGFHKADVCNFPSFEELSKYWKSDILVKAHPLYEKDTDIVNGMYYDPVEYIPRHMERWLERMELEGRPLPPGFYKVKFKVEIGN